MLALHDIDTGLHRVLAERVNEEPTYNFSLMIELTQKAFFTVT